MPASKRPSFLKRQKEQQRAARALEKREAKRARKLAKQAGTEAADLEPLSDDAATGEGIGNGEDRGGRQGGGN